ncbi:hypothetical protein O181_094804 [Austropuccinia psidii MF-1]|uniref:Uncharacterized protein n=1 Tax=Austropuccinia psidii MF-1 TaxID=1389203 RepID=A0A9Q3J3W1_9BASI|nr:hypothetical protein [Austropuccinia psidii MF-1]
MEEILHQGKSCVNRWRLTSRRTVLQDNINRHMCHMRVSLKAQTHFNTIHNVRVISPLWLPHPHLIRHNYLHVYEPALPSRLDSDTAPPLRPHHSLRFHTPAHTIFMLTWCTPNMLPTSLILTLAQVPSQYAPDTAYDHYARGVHSQHAPDTNYPYACVVPSRHAPNTAYPYACVVPSRHAPDTAYHPYARGVHSRHAPNTTYHPYACGVHSRHAPDTTYPYACVVPSRHHLSLRLCGALLTPLILTLAECLSTCSRHDLSLRFRPTSIVYGGLLAYTMNAIAKIPPGIPGASMKGIMWSKQQCSNTIWLIDSWKMARGIIRVGHRLVNSWRASSWE